MAVPGAHAKINAAVLEWPGIRALPHRFGGTEYRLGAEARGREIGHVHGDWLVDIPFPTKVRDALVSAGQAQPHHILPESGWVSCYLRAPADVDQALALLRQSYDLAARQQAARRSGAG